MNTRAAQAGEGVSFVEAVLPPATRRRIEWLGQIDDRCKVCLADRGWEGLRIVASG